MTVFATITLNASVDTTYTLDRLDLGGINRVSCKEAVAGGKGNNVARVLSQLGHRVIATGFAGGASGDFIERSLRAEGVEPAFMPTPGDSRTCLTVIERETGQITEIREAGDPITPSLAASFLDRVPDLLGEADAVTICGSMPPGLPDDYLALLCARLARPGRVIAIDSSGEPLRRALDANPDVIKPNLDELTDLAGPTALSDPAAAAETLRAEWMGANGTMLVTLGAAGAIAVTPNGTWRATPPPVNAVNPVGSGDAFLAGWLTGSDPEQALRLGVAAGAAAALQSRIGVVDSADVARIAPLVRIEAIR